MSKKQFYEMTEQELEEWMEKNPEKVITVESDDPERDKRIEELTKI